MKQNEILQSSLEELTNITNMPYALLDLKNGDVFGTFSEEQLGDVVSVREKRNSERKNSEKRNTEKINSEKKSSGYHFMKITEEYQLITRAEEDSDFLYARIAESEIRHILSAFQEELTVESFYQKLLLQQISEEETIDLAKQLEIPESGNRVVYYLQMEKNLAESGAEILRNLFTDSPYNQVCLFDQTNLILVKFIKTKKEELKLLEYADQIVSMIGSELMVNVKVSYGNPVSTLTEIVKSYKEAKIAKEVAEIFYDGRIIAAYASLGIGRLIHELPASLCETFLEEVFGDKKRLQLTEDELTTIDRFFANNLNISETARELFMHRNTLVYHLEKLQKTTGLDIRKFDDALTFKLATMVARYMNYLKQ